MADADHPKTHVEDQDLSEPRVQPESPHREGIDPLTEGDTMYPKEDTKAESEKLAKSDDREASKLADAGENQPGIDETDQVAADQQEVDAKANTPNANLPDDAKTETTDQKADEAKADGEVPADSDKPAAPADAKEQVVANATESPSDGSGVDASKPASN